MNDMIIPQSGTVGKWDDSAFDKASKSGEGYLPRMQLMTSNSEKCKEGAFQVNNFALVDGEDYKDLGKNVDTLIFAWRPKAVQISDTPITSYDPDSDTFVSIAERSGDQESGCMYGIEFLVYIASVGKFATFFFGSKSARKEAPNVKEYVGHAATFLAKKITTTKYTWFIPSVQSCSTLGASDIPEGYAEVVDKFNNPTESGVEIAADAPESGRER